MTTLTHIAVGAVIAKAALSGSHAHLDPMTVYAVSILFSNLPDLTTPIIYIRYRLAKSHHLYSLFHKPLFWVSIYVFLQIFLPKNLWEIISPYVLIAGISLTIHFLMDSFGPFNGVVWLAPIIKKEISFVRLFPAPLSSREWLVTYSKTLLHKTEYLIVGSSLVYLIFKH